MINNLGDVQTFKFVVVCPHCKGTRKENRWDEYDMRYEIPCTYCQGDGLLKKIRTTKYERIDYAEYRTDQPEVLGT